MNKIDFQKLKKKEDMIIAFNDLKNDYRQLFAINDDLEQELQRKDNIINELKNGIKELDNMFYETFRISQDGYFSISEWELKDFTDKIKEIENGK